MTDYAAYREDRHITNKQFIDTLHSEYDGFTKIQSSYISHPDDYALCLTDEAENVLIKQYGIGPGLAHYKLKSKRRKDNRQKKNRMTVRLSDDIYSRVCLLYTSPSPRDRTRSRMPSSA